MERIVVYFSFVLVLSLLVSWTQAKAPLYAASAPDSDYQDEYIVVLKNDEKHKPLLNAEKLAKIIRNDYKGKVYRELSIKKFVALHVHTKSDIIEKLLDRAEIGYIERNQKVKVVQSPVTTPKPVATTTEAYCISQNTGRNLWGLGRISVRETPQDSYSTRYVYGNNDSGQDVTVYVADTGINIEHEDFGGRAVWGMTASNMLNEEETDLAGHGTHVAGIIGSTTYGVAKNAKLVAVKVLNKDGVGSTVDILEGIEWIRQQAESQSKSGPVKAIVNLSLGAAGAAYSMEEAILQAIDDGINFVVAAGNEYSDACLSSPARISRAITVGASTVDDRMAEFSNMGPCVDVLAPGTEIMSTYIGSTSAYALLQGTSMASPFVAGAVARYLSRQGESPTPAQVKSWIIDSATKDTLKFSSYEIGTPNKLLYIACGALGEEPEALILNSASKSCQLQINFVIIGILIFLGMT